MKNKLLKCIVGLSMIFNSAVSAEIIHSTPDFLADGYVCIEGKTDAKNASVTFKAAKVGGKTDYVAIMEEIADAEGNFRFVFRLPEQINGVSSNGTYDFFIMADGEELKQSYFEYINFEYMLEKIKSAKSKDELYSVLQNCGYEDKLALKAMGIAVDEMEKIWDDIKNVSDRCFDICDISSSELQTIVLSFNKSLGVEYAQKGDADTALHLINPSYDNVKYNDDENKIELAEVVKNNLASDSAVEFENAYILANKIIEFRNLRAAELIEAIEKYNDYFGFKDSNQYSVYSKMTLTTQGKTAEKMSQYIGKSTVTAKQIMDAFEKAVSETEPGNNPDGGRSGGGGSSGSYSSGAAVSTFEIEHSGKKDKFADLSYAVWAKEAVEALAEKSIIAGFGDGNFYPNNSVTREEFTKMLVLAAKMYNESAECDFIDTDKDKWHYKYIASAYEKGIVNGIGVKSFGVGSNITRQDMAVMVKRAADISGIKKEPVRTKRDFSDFGDISEYAAESVNELYICGIINGTDEGLFMPLAYCTRAQAAKVIYETFLG